MVNFKLLTTTSLLLYSLFSSTEALAQTDEVETGGSTAEVVEQKLNINRATFEQLIALKGIGPAKAQAILDYIQLHGDLVSLDELLEIRGIGQRLLAKLKLQLVL